MGKCGVNEMLLKVDSSKRCTFAPEIDKVEKRGL